MGSEPQVDLEFEVEVDDDCTDAELQNRLQHRLQNLLQHRVLNVQAGHEAAVPIASGGFDVPPTSAYRGIGGAESPAIGARWRSGSEGAVTPGDLRERYNHPTTPNAPRFTRDDSYWSQRKNSRIRERKNEDNRKSQDENEQVRPFRAKPVPPSVSAPRFQAMRAAEEASRQQRAIGEQTAENRRRCRSADIQVSDDEDVPPFRAKPVPWKVSAPLYDQMLLEEQHARRIRVASRSRALMRASSLPPRLEAVKRRLCGDDGMNPGSDGGSRVYRSTTPVPRSQLAQGPPPASHVVNRPLRSEEPRGPSGFEAGGMIDAAENMAREVAAGQIGVRDSGGYRSGVGRGGSGGSSPVGWSGPGVYASGYGISHMARHTDPPRHSNAGVKGRQEQDPGGVQRFHTTEVPDFVALHERERLKLERAKYQKRYVTQPEPFIFHAPSRAQLRQPAMVKDPSEDWRWRRHHGVRRASSAAAQHNRNVAGFGPPLNGPATAVPPRSTAKTLQAQQATQRALQERREQELYRQQEDQQRLEPNIRMKNRVKNAVGIVEPLEDKIERLVTDKRHSRQRVVRQKERDLQNMKARVDRRPLLMEQTDSLARARRRALFRVRETLQAAGLDDIENHFRDEELDDMGMAEPQGFGNEARGPVH